MFDDFNSRRGIKLDEKYTSHYIDDLDVDNGEENLRKDDEDSFIGKSISYKRINFLMVFFVLGLFILTARVWFIQIANGEYYSSIAEGNRIRIKSIKPQRGIIFDKNYKPLVINVPSFSLKILQSDLPKDDGEKDALISEVAGLINEKKEDILKFLEENKGYYYQSIIIKENIGYNEALSLYIKSIDMPGVSLEEVSRRLYISNNEINSISHILGYNGKISESELAEKKDKEYLLDDYIGKAGVEFSFENLLRGDLGKSRIETNALGKEIQIIAKKDPVAGSDIVLSIDFDLQNYIENLLKEELKKLNKTRAAVVVIDPRQGEVLSLVSIPSYDNNLFVQGIGQEEYTKLLEDKDKPLFNRAIAGAYPPGSTFKPLLTAMALKENIINEKTTVRSTGGIWVEKWFFPDWLPGGHGTVNIKGAIANSVNTFFYYIGGGYNDFEGLGIERIVKDGKTLNLGSKTGIDLPGENSGFLPDPLWKADNFDEAWYIGDTYHISIGQGYLLMSPLQVGLYTSFFANGGTLYKPKIVKSIITPEKERIDIASEIIAKDFISKSDIDIIREGMRDTVRYGSGRFLADLPYEVAGKTGTAQFNNNNDAHAWFTCFAPYDNPEIAMTILVEEGGEGSTVSVPIVKNILKYWWAKKSESP
ncbi:MAG: penicillin-binding protein 2 [bacterium]